MTHELRPAVQHEDYIPDELKKDLTSGELQILRSVDSRTELSRLLSDYHGFPWVQIAIWGSWEVKPEDPRPAPKFLRDARTKEERDHIISCTIVRAVVTGPSDRTRD